MDRLGIDMGWYGFYETPEYITYAFWAAELASSWAFFISIDLTKAYELDKNNELYENIRK